MLKTRIENSPLLKATLAGVVRVMQTTLGIERSILSVNNNPKQGLKAIHGDLKYPYGWVKFPSMMLNADRALLKNIARNGSGYGTGRSNTSATVKINHHYPAKLNLDCIVKFQQYSDVLDFVQLLLIAAASDLLNFKIALATDDIQVTVAVEGHSAALPMIDDLEEGSSPGTFEYQFSLTVDTKIGFNRDVAKINNEGVIQLDEKLEIG